ncbi:MAG: SDR family NAD(P)-dependent oxidoreductase [Actinomycetota bacterium]
MDLGLTGRRALVTGSYRGTGAGIARALADEGAHVIVHGFESGQPEATMADIIEAGGSCEAVIADIGTDAGAAELAAAAGEVDIVVANYGAPVGSTWSSLDEWAAEWDRNVLAAVRVIQPFTAGMVARGWGRVVVIGTVGSRMPGTHNPGYYAAKAGLPVLVRTLAKELGGSGVTANLVSPGMIATSEVREMLTARATKRGLDADWETVHAWAIENAMPNLTGRIPDPIDIGRVVAFVAGDAGWHINGAEVPLDGGTIDA